MRHRSTARRSLAGAVLALALALSAPSVARAAPERMGREAGLGAASALLSLLYGPAKVLYAAGGGAIAGLAWVFSAGDSDVVSPILTAALRGDYVITPQHLTGKRDLEFIGRAPADRSLRNSGY